MQGQDVDVSVVSNSISSRNNAADGNGGNLGALSLSGSGIPAMPDFMSIGGGGFGMTSETWGQVAARAAMLAAQLRELESANSLTNPGQAQHKQSEESTSRSQEQQQGSGGGMWLQPGHPAFAGGQELPGGMSLGMFGPQGLMADRMVQNYQMRLNQQPLPGTPAGGAMTQEDLVRSLQGLAPGAAAMLAAGMPALDGFRRPRLGVAAETRRQNDKEKKRRKRERIGELVRAVRPPPPATPRPRVRGLLRPKPGEAVSHGSRRPSIL